MHGIHVHEAFVCVFSCRVYQGYRECVCVQYTQPLGSHTWSVKTSLDYRMRTFSWFYIHISTYICIHIHRNMHIGIYTYKNMYTWMCACLRIHIHTYIHILCSPYLSASLRYAFFTSTSVAFLFISSVS